MNKKTYTIRIIALLALFNLISGIGTTLLFDFFSLREFTLIKWIVYILFIILFTHVSYGSSIALIGFWVKLWGGDKYRILETIRNKEVNLENVGTAIVMPIYGEDIGEVCARIETMYNSINEEKYSSNFDFFILSDTRDLEKWVKEEEEYLKLCKKLNSFGRIYYRRRKINLNKKSGNLADFCRRWGKRYEYMIVLDADSLITGKLMIKLSQLMESNPAAGIIQSYPKLIRAETIYQKIMQYTSIIHSKIFGIGANYWQLNSSSFWGHNAIIRMKPFMDYCGLPSLPKLGAIGGKILSHDTIEAALIRREGFSVWSVYDLEGSYEECPPNLVDSLKRDERWCQGNLQHFWFLFAKGLRKSSRFHIFLGIFSYLSSFFWLLFLIGTIFLYVEDLKFFRLSMEPEEWKKFWDYIYYEKSWKLFLFTYTVLFLPRIITIIDSIIFRENKNHNKGFFIFYFSYILEFIFSVFQAPILMYMHTKFIVLTLIGKKNEWKSQNRSSDNTPKFREVFQVFNIMSFTGLALGIYFYFYLDTLFYLLMPIWGSWFLSPLIAYVSGLKLESESLFLSEEFGFEKEVIILKDKLNKIKNNLIIKLQNIPIFFMIVVDPFYNSLHCLFQKHKGELVDKKRKRIEIILEKILKSGPDSLTISEEILLLNDSRILRKLYYKFWEEDLNQSDPYWIENYKKYKSTL